MGKDDARGAESAGSNSRFHDAIPDCARGLISGAPTTGVPATRPVSSARRARSFR